MLVLPVAIVALALTPTGSFDFGDAPDGAPAGYAGKSVRGSFPSKAASGGPRHSSSGPRIGTRWTGESSSRQVDRDTDDGAQLEARSCAVSTVSFVLDATRVPAGTPISVNAWFDWNQDGDWADGGTSSCGPEWGLQNVRIDPAALDSTRVAAVTLRFRAGKVPAQLWWRLQVHVGEPAPHLAGGGRGETTAGETEDSFHDRAPHGSEAHIDCVQPVRVAPHGGRVLARYVLDAPPGTPIAITRVRHDLDFDARGTRGIRRRDGPRAWVLQIRSLHRHRVQGGRPVTQEVIAWLFVDAIVNGEKRDLVGKCRAFFVHARPLAPPFQPPRTTAPAPTAAVDPIRPDPVQARCAASFVPFGWTPGSIGASGGGIDVRCDGVDVRSLSVSAGSGSQKIASVFEHDGFCNPVTVNGIEERAVRCLPRLPNKGKLVSFGYRTDSPFASTTLHVLAGGVQAGGTGTTIVLRQTFFFPREGMTCSQSIPAAPSCATLP